MRKVTGESISRQSSEASQAILTLDSGRPFVHFNNDLKINGCNDLFVNTFKISKSILLSSELVQIKQNKLFVEALLKAKAEGIGTFHGNLLFGTGLSEVYIEAILLNTASKNPEAGEIFCYILEHVFSDPDAKPAAAGSDSAIPGYPHASVSVHTPDGVAVYISPSTEVMLGYSNTEIKKLGSLNLIYPDDLPVVKEAIGKLNSGLDFLTTRYRMVHKNGSILFVETTSYILGDASGKTNHIVNITSDLGSHQGIEQALKISEQKYYRLVMNLPVGVSLITARGKLLEVNDAMKKIMRIPRDFPILELNFLNIEGMKRAGLCDQFRKCLELKEDVNGETQIKLSRRSRESYLTYSFVPILDHKGEIESVIGYVNDLTNQKKAENDNLEKIDFLNLVINTIKTSFFVKDQYHQWVMLNDAAVEMMGRPREALIGKSDYDFYPKEQADIFWKYDELVFKSGSSSNEEQITWADGTIHTVLTHKQLYKEKLSGKKFIVGTSHDITRYKKIEEELRASNVKYRELFDNANDFILTTDINGKITNANRTLLRYLKAHLELLMEHNVFEFIKEENIDFANEIKTKILSGDLVNPFEIKAYGIENKDVIYEVKASLIIEDGVPEGLQFLFSDITERHEAAKRLEKYNEKLLELNTTKDKFFRIIAHDLRNPYSSLIGFSEMLLEDLDDLTKDEIRESLKIILGSAKNSFSLLENLLAWSRLETGHIPFIPVEIVLYDFVEEVVNVLFSVAYRKRIEICNLVNRDVILFADKNMLTAILNNLIMNAIKFTYAGGEIKIYAHPDTIETDSGQNFIKVSVADNGVGMDEETRDLLFTPNRKDSNPGTEKEQGTGLGLLITREMVEKHGGKIMVESSPGRGSVFSFLIPEFKPGNS
jgi:PAS domain S-box-containing protein